MKVKACEVTFSNLDEGISEQLQQNKEIIDEFLKTVAGQVRDEAKKSADFADKTGNLRRSIRMRRSKFVDGGYIVSASGRNDGDEKGYHALLVEYGHEIVTHDGKSTGKRTAATSFFRTAVDRGSVYAASLIASLRSK